METIAYSQFVVNLFFGGHDLEDLYAYPPFPNESGHITDEYGARSLKKYPRLEIKLDPQTLRFPIGLQLWYLILAGLESCRFILRLH